MVRGLESCPSSKRQGREGPDSSWYLPHGTAGFAPLRGGVARPPGLERRGLGQVTTYLQACFFICGKVKGWASVE